MKNLSFIVFLVSISVLSCRNKEQEYEPKKINRILNIGIIEPVKLCSENSFSSFNGDGHAIYQYQLTSSNVESFKDRLINSEENIFPSMKENKLNNWSAFHWKTKYSSKEDIKVIEFLESYINHTEEYKSCSIDVRKENNIIFSYLLKKSAKNIIGLEFYLIDEMRNTITICEIYL